MTLWPVSWAGRLSWCPSALCAAPLVVLFVVPVVPASAADRASLEVNPGPQVMSAEERSLVPDPALGAEHGIVLADETVLDQTSGTDTLMRHHFRAKIFSAEARGLADVEIPIGVLNHALKKWWGWCILPDGSVRDLPQSGLQEQEEARGAGVSFKVLKAILPGVVPGSVIDYGWSLWSSGVEGWTKVEIQREWPIRSLRLRWTPSPWGIASFHLSRPKGVTVEAVRSQRAVLIEGRDLPAALEEPWMPPRQNSFATLTLYYRRSDDPPKAYWDLEAKRLDRRVGEFCRDAALQGMIASMGLPDGGSLDQRLRTAYDWFAAHLQNTGFETMEEAEAAPEDDKKARNGRLRQILAERRASDEDLEVLYVCVARALGAEAHLALAADRRSHLFDTTLLTAWQFDRTLGCIRTPGDPDDRATLVDTGVGLPYGAVAWWVTGAAAFLADPRNPRSILVRASDPRANVSETMTRVTFDPASGNAAVRWSREARGQHGLAERISLRRMPPEERTAWLRSACGARGDPEVDRAASPGLEEPATGFRMECEEQMLGTNISMDLSSYSFGLVGPWIEPYPEFPAGVRLQPVLFEFPRIDHNIIEFPSPPGFEPDTDRLIIPAQSPFGDYRLTIEPAESGYRVERRLALTAVGVPPQYYEDLRQFLVQVARADRTRLVFRRVEAEE